VQTVVQCAQMIHTHVSSLTDGCVVLGFCVFRPNFYEICVLA